MTFKKIALQLGTLVGASLFTLNLNAQGGGSENQMDFESLKSKCLELSSNQQLKPFKAIVTCRDVRSVWREAQAKDQKPLPNYREVGASIRMKGFETPYAGVPVPLDPSQANCVVFEKYTQTVPSVDAELTCDELNAIEDLTQYCVEQIGQRIQDDPSAVIEEPTGERYNSCAGPAGVQGEQARY